MSRFCYLILNYETYEETLACVRSVKETAAEGLENGADHIIVVDNGSSPENLEALKTGLEEEGVVLIEAGKNLGFAKGNNLGFAYAKKEFDPDFIVMMNNDIILVQKDMEERISYLYDRFRFAVAGGDWTNPDESIHFNPQMTVETSPEAIDEHIAKFEQDIKLCKVGVEPVIKAAKRVTKAEKTPARLELLRSRIEEKTLEGEEHIAVKCNSKNQLQLHGCMLIFSRKYISLFDGLYDKTFLYYEEDFLRLRCERRNLKMYFFPELSAIHMESATENAINRSVREKHMKRNENMIRSLRLLKAYMEDPNADTEIKHIESITDKKISIAMTTYNGEKYVVEQLDSLLAQTLQPDEIIIADDKSTDSTWELLQQYVADHPEAPITLELNEENMGYKKNFHSVLKQVTGDYIFLCDQDDNWNPDKLELCVRLMEAHPEVLALNTSFEFMDAEDKPVQTVLLKGRANNNIVRATMYPDELRRFGTEALVLANLSPGCTMCIRKHIIDEFNESYNYALPHDYFINLIASLEDGCFFLNTPTIRYRIHDKNTIGLIVLEKDESRPFYDLQVKGVYSTRMKEAEDLIEIFDAVWETGIEQKWSGRYRDFLKKRYATLRDRSLIGFAGLLMHPHLYHKIFTVRRIFGDLYYVLHMDEILKRH